MKTVALFSLSAAALLVAWRMKRQRDAALTLAEDALATAGAAIRSLENANDRIEDLTGSMPVWLLAGLPMVDVVPMACDFCLN